MISVRRKVLAGALVAMALVLVAAACNGDDEEPIATPTPEPTPAPTPEPTPEPTPTPPPGLPGASCAPQTGGDPDVLMFLTDVRIAPHPGFDRIVFEFITPEGQPGGIPYHEVELTEPPLIEHPTGFELDVEGESFLEILYWATGVDLSGPEPRETYVGPDQFLPDDTAVIEELRQGGDFEATSHWYVGMSEEACFLVSTLEDPFRIVVDIEDAP